MIARVILVFNDFIGVTTYEAENIKKQLVKALFSCD